MMLHKKSKGIMEGWDGIEKSIIDDLHLVVYYKGAL